MLKQRVITAVILLPLVVGVLLTGPAWLVEVLLAIGMLLAAREWAPLAGFSGRGWALAYSVLAALLAAAGMVGIRQSSVLPAILVVACIWWLLALGLILWRPHLPAWLAGCAGLLAIVPAWLAILQLYQDAVYGPQWLVFLLALVWAADIGAYFAGRAFGRHKLAPQVSPGKTWEGLAGGLVLALLVGAAGAWWFVQPLPNLLALVILVTLASVVGDLTESLFKRRAGVKDSSSLLPGHGGVLDRLDSLLAAAPLFVLGLQASALTG